MLTVELIYDAHCPNVEEARAQLMRSLVKTGLPPRWKEWERNATESPDYAKKYGSPTILVNGQDIAENLKSSDANHCRLYESRERKLMGVPSVEVITMVLLKHKREGSLSSNSKQAGGVRRVLAVLPGVGTVLLPKLLCPACWPAYAGLLSSLGLGFINYTPYLFPLTVLFLIMALAALGYGAKKRWGYGPFVLGIVAFLVIILGKFVFNFDGALYGGIILLVGASLWNVWPRKKEVKCNECET